MKKLNIDMVHNLADRLNDAIHAVENAELKKLPAALRVLHTVCETLTAHLRARGVFDEILSVIAPRKRRTAQALLKFVLELDAIVADGHLDLEELKKLPVLVAKLDALRAIL